MIGRLSRRALLSAAAVGVAGLAGCFGRERDAEETITETVETADVDRVTIASGAGSVTVAGEDRETVGVRGAKRAAIEDDLERIRLRIDRYEGELSIVVERYAGDDGVFSTGPDPIMDLEVTVPDSLRVASVESDAGSIEVSGVRGDLAVRSETGEQTITGIDGAVTATAETGSIEVAGTTATGDLTTDTGSISAEIRALEDDASVETTTGRVDATLVPPVDAAVVATTNTGELTADGFEDVGGTMTENRFEVTLGAGTYDLDVAADTGDVALSLEG